MKKKLFLLGMAALLCALGLVLTGCDDGNGGGEDDDKVIYLERFRDHGGNVFYDSGTDEWLSNQHGTEKYILNLLSNDYSIDINSEQGYHNVSVSSNEIFSTEPHSPKQIVSYLNVNKAFIIEFDSGVNSGVRFYFWRQE
jgi:hypothetical protein